MNIRLDGRIDRPDKKRVPVARRSELAPYVLIGGAAVYMAMLILGPTLYEFYLSLTDARLLRFGRQSFIGLENYRQSFSNPQLYGSVRISLIYTVATVGLATVLGLVAALAVNRPIAGRGLGRAVLILPWAMPSVAAAIIFTWIFNQETGVLNRLIDLGSGQPQPWLTDPGLALAAVIGVSVWKTFPFAMLTILAALQSIPGELYEAARLDQADELTAYREITWPHICPALAIMALLLSIWAFRRFEIIWLLTQGGPLGATNTLVLDVYRVSFINGEIGRGAAIGMIGLCFSMLITVIYIRLTRRAADERAGS